MEAVGERLRSSLKPCAAELYAVLQGLELSVERGWGMVEVAGERMVIGSEDCWAEGILIG